MSRPFKHPRTGVYYYRRAVPADLKAAIGKREVKFSLQTKDPHEARSKYAVFAVRVDAEWADLRRRKDAASLPALQELDAATIKRIGEAYYAHLLDEDEERRVDGFGSSEHVTIRLPEHSKADAVFEHFAFRHPTFEEAIASQAEFEAIVRHDYARGSADEFFMQEVDEVLSWDGLEIKLDPDSPSRRQVARELQASAIKAAKAIRARNEGEPIETPPYPSPLRSASSQSNGGVAGEGHQPVMALFEGWEREGRAAGLVEKTIKEYRAVLTRFVAALEHDDASRIRPADVVAYKDKRLAEGRSLKTVKDADLSALKSVFGWAVRNHKLPINPAEGVTLKLGKKARERGPGFTDEEAKAILSASTKYVPVEQEHVKTTAAKRWLPWLCAYTGARIGELTQLRRQDVRQDAECWVIIITPEAGPVKNKEMREVPLHPHLVEIGFLQFVHSSKDGYLFLNASNAQEMEGRLRAVKNRVAEFVREVVPDKRVAPNHGWRHRFVYKSRKYGIDLEKRRMILGHSGKGVDERVYGEPAGLYAEVLKLPRYDVEV